MAINVVGTSFDGSDMINATAVLTGLAIATSDKVISYTLGSKVYVFKYDHE